MIENALAFARRAWPLGFTKREIEEALGHPVSMLELIRLRAIENTKVKRKRGRWRDTVWRYKPYQLKLPLEETDGAGQAKDT